MPSKKQHKKEKSSLTKQKIAVPSKLKVGDKVMVVAGGSKGKRDNKGAIGKIIAFAGKKSDRVVVEGVNYVVKHKRQTSMQDQAEKITKEAPIHISNVMFYAEKIKKPVRLSAKFLEDGTKVRGYQHEGEFVQV